MKYASMMMAVLSLALLSAGATAQPPGKGPNQKNDQADGPRRGPGQRGEQGRRGPGGAERDPAEMVARMIQQYDKDGDQKLDKQELTAMFTAMRERGAAGQRAGGPGMRPGANPGQRGDKRPGDQPGRRRGEQNGEAGGDKPDRRPAE